MFTHCLRRHEKRSYAICVTPWFSVWTSLGLNQGPPDYEPQKAIFYDISWYVTILMVNELYFCDFYRNSQNTPDWNKKFTHCLRRRDFCLFSQIYKTHRLTCYHLFIRGIITKSLFYLLCLRNVYALFTQKFESKHLYINAFRWLLIFAFTLLKAFLLKIAFLK